MNRWFAGHILFPVVTTLRGERLRGPLRQYQRDQWETPDRIREIQWDRIQSLLQRSYDEVPFYREMFEKQSLHPKDVASFADFQKLPTVSKSDLHSRGKDLLSGRRPWRYTLKSTAGSTSLPVTVMKTAYSMAWERAASWLAYNWYGIHQSDREGRFWGVAMDPKVRRKYEMIDWIRNRIRCSAFEMNDEHMADYFRRCKSFGVDWFYGYTLALDEFAQFVLRTGLDGRSLKLKCIVGTAEQMSELARERLSEAFGCRVVDEYGCGETGAIAYECDEGRRHIMAENVYLEILDENGQPVQPGQTGEIVCTELNNTAQPLIRYRVADMGALSPDPCPCGRGLPVLQQLLGRLYDVIYAPNGNVLHGEVFGYMFKVLRMRGAPVKQYQVVQETPDLVRFKIVEEGQPLSSEHRQYLETETWKRMGDTVKIEFEKVSEIPRLASGKMRLIESRLRRP